MSDQRSVPLTPVEEAGIAFAKAFYAERQAASTYGTPIHVWHVANLESEAAFKTYALLVQAEKEGLIDTGE